PAAERPVQVVAGVAPGLGGKQHVIGGDAVEHQTAETAAESQRNPDHQLEDGEIASFLLFEPVAAGRLGRAHGVAGVRLPAATSRSAARTWKAMAPLALGSSEKTRVSPGPTGLKNLALPTCHCATGRSSRRSAKRMAWSSRTTPGTIGRPGK